jgi:hypothetical protein
MIALQKEVLHRTIHSSRLGRDPRPASGYRRKLCPSVPVPQNPEPSSDHPCEAPGRHARCPPDRLRIYRRGHARRTSSKEGRLGRKLFDTGLMVIDTVLGWTSLNLVPGRLFASLICSSFQVQRCRVASRIRVHSVCDMGLNTSQCQL